MTDETTHLKLPYILANQAQKHVTHNEAIRLLDGLVQMSVIDRDLAAPPGSPNDGDRYIVASGATGAWAGWDSNIAYSVDGAWTRLVPRNGWLSWIEDEDRYCLWNGSAWIPVLGDLTASDLASGSIALLGVGTAADATNPFSAKLNKALWTAKGTGEGGDGDLRYTLNKEAAGNVLSLLFQAGWSARAEIGLLGDDDFTFKVSPDGSNWFQAFKVSAASGLITPLPGGIAGGGRLKSFQYFSASGTWNRPTGIRFVLAEVLGAGGGSGGCTGAASSVAVGAGGAGGGYSRKLIDVTAIASVAVTVGTGGTAGANTGTAGGTGGTSSFGAHCSATGGTGGAGMTAGTAVAVSQGGLGGQGVSGDYDFAGAPGSHGMRLSGTIGISGNAGVGFFGGGARGNIGSAVGSAGNSRGSGASGAATNNATARAGAVGADGLVVVWESE